MSMSSGDTKHESSEKTELLLNKETTKRNSPFSGYYLAPVWPFLIYRHESNYNVEPEEPTPPVSLERQRLSLIDETPLDTSVILAREKAIQKNTVKSKAAKDAVKTVLYLAYGSNLCAETFRGVRGIRPLAQTAVLVPELRLMFDIPGMPYIEPCFSSSRYCERENDESDPGKVSHYHHGWNKPIIGVVYEVTISDYVQILATEGGGQAYQDVVVDCCPFPEGYTSDQPIPDVSELKETVFKAHCLLSFETAHQIAEQHHEKLHKKNKLKYCEIKRPEPWYAQPSERYKALLTRGAAEHDLPLEYQEFLTSLTPYQITTERQRIGRLFICFVFLPLWIGLMVIGRMFANKGTGRFPWWVAIGRIVVGKVTWVTYDWVFKPLFGDGERTMETEGEPAEPTPAEMQT